MTVAAGDYDPVTALEVEKLGNGCFVWTLDTPGGASFRGARQYKTRSRALADGERWLDDIRSHLGDPPQLV